MICDVGEAAESDDSGQSGDAEAYERDGRRKL